MDVRRSKVVYFARPKTQYPYYSMKEDMILNAALYGQDFPRNYQILDPDDPMLAQAYANLKAIGHPDHFTLFTLLATSADYIIGATFQDGVMGAGVANEIAAYFNMRARTDLEFGKPRVWVVQAIKKHGRYTYRLTHHDDFNSVKDNYQLLTIPATREYISHGVI